MVIEGMHYDPDCDCKDCRRTTKLNNLNNMNSKTEGEEIREWEKEFDKKFHELECDDPYYNPWIASKDMKESYYLEDVKDFISSLLSSKAKEVCERMEKGKLTHQEEMTPENAEISRYYNEAIEIAQLIVKEAMK